MQLGILTTLFVVLLVSAECSNVFPWKAMYRRARDVDAWCSDPVTLEMCTAPLEKYMSQLERELPRDGIITQALLDRLPEICAKLDETTSCIRKTFLDPDCDDEPQILMPGVLGMMDFTCSDRGQRLFAEIVQSSPCTEEEPLMIAFFQLLYCAEAFTEDVGDMDRLWLKPAEDICPPMTTMMTCFLRDTETICGVAAKEFVEGLWYATSAEVPYINQCNFLGQL